MSGPRCCYRTSCPCLRRKFCNRRRRYPHHIYPNPQAAGNSSLRQKKKRGGRRVHSGSMRVYHIQNPNSPKPVNSIPIHQQHPSSTTHHVGHQQKQLNNPSCNRLGYYVRTNGPTGSSLAISSSFHQRRPLPPHRQAARGRAGLVCSERGWLHVMKLKCEITKLIDSCLAFFKARCRGWGLTLPYLKRSWENSPLPHIINLLTMPSTPERSGLNSAKEETPVIRPRNATASFILKFLGRCLRGYKIGFPLNQ